MVQVHHDEGVANRIDPESCADAREGIGEALTGERIGQPLSRESTLILGADVVPLTEGNTDGRDNASAQTARRGRRHWHVRTLFAREPGDLMVGQRHLRAELVRVGYSPTIVLVVGYYRLSQSLRGCLYRHAVSQCGCAIASFDFDLNRVSSHEILGRGVDERNGR